MNHSYPAVRVPIRASSPSDTTSASIAGEKGRDLGLVGLKLLERRSDRRVLVGRVLQLENDQGQSVDEQNDVRAAFVLVLDHCELVDREPVVVLRGIEVDHAEPVRPEPHHLGR